MEEIKNSTTLSEQTKKNYLRVLKMLNGKEPKNLAFLKDTEKISQKILSYENVQTRVTYFLPLIVVLKGNKRYKKEYDFYHDLWRQSKGIVNEIKNTKTEKQEENWVDVETIQKIYDDLKDHNNYTSHMHFVVLSFYLLNEPRRNKDLQFLRRCQNEETMIAVEDYEQYNFFLVDEKKFVFFNYKTKHSNGRQDVPISEELYQIFLDFLEFHPRKEEPNHFIITDSWGCHSTNTNFITYILNDIFKSTGKKIGVNMLRTIRLTDKYKTKMVELQDDMEETASLMGTSVSMIKNHYTKLD
jgi:hypothetical protein